MNFGSSNLLLYSVLRVRYAPLAQLVEHLTLNQGVPGSNPWWCTKARKGAHSRAVTNPYQSPRKRLVGQAVKTPASHAGNAGSIPARVTKKKRILDMYGGKNHTELVLMTLRVHPFPCRTRKLSSVVPKILDWWRSGKIGRRQHERDTQ